MTKEQIQKLITEGKTRFCKKCNKDLPVTEFYIKTSSNKNHFRFNSPCKKCSNIYQVVNRSEYQRKYHLLKKFNIDIETYNKMLSEQNNSCFICNVKFDNDSKKFAVDHCHETNNIRGLLCQNCNTGLGFFRDNIEILQNAIEYLRRHKNWTN